MNEALKHNPKNEDFLNNLGMFYSNIYEYKKAEKKYKKGPTTLYLSLINWNTLREKVLGKEIKEEWKVLTGLHG